MHKMGKWHLSNYPIKQYIICDIVDFVVFAEIEYESHIFCDEYVLGPS